MKSPDTVLEVSGAKLLAACGYDHKLCGALIAMQDDDAQKELLSTIGAAITFVYFVSLTHRNAG